jgi:hypothetical protein
MRRLAMVLGLALGAALLFTDVPRAVADVSAAPPSVPAVTASAVAISSPSPRPGSDAEAQDYALREEASPEAQEFTGGETVVISVSLLAILLVVLIVILLSRD